MQNWSVLISLTEGPAAAISFSRIRTKVALCMHTHLVFPPCQAVFLQKRIVRIDQSANADCRTFPFLFSILFWHPKSLQSAPICGVFKCIPLFLESQIWKTSFFCNYLETQRAKTHRSSCWGKNCCLGLTLHCMKALPPLAKSLYAF